MMMDEENNKVNDNDEIQNWLGLLEEPFHSYNMNYEEITTPSPIVSPDHSKSQQPSPQPTGGQDHGATLETEIQEAKKKKDNRHVQWNGDVISIRKATKNNEKKGKQKEKKVTNSISVPVRRRRSVGRPKTASTTESLPCSAEERSTMSDTPQDFNHSSPSHNSIVTGIRSIRNTVEQKMAMVEDGLDNNDEDASIICQLCKKSLLKSGKTKPKQIDILSSQTSTRQPRKRNNDVANNNIEVVLKSLLAAEMRDDKMNINCFVFV